ncbi:heteromeric transposase endonuclease subunit TnsA [Derxia gummosa]|uniref:Heteromeric transposase endonuclease subunit TnsA n=1 Tax=Derxia gummosa DSM 723 TaxID=1121388 RepID=A0A8B6XAF9_9BURK|nr:heteromeric transposase endonuclease subunit TnsA [Derxia gummosa]
MSRRIYSPKTNRVHHLLSNVENDLFVALEWSREITDIREQYPLDRDVTTEVAASLGIKHPYYVGTHVRTVMTVDFLCTRMRAGMEEYVAFNAKRTEEASDRRSLEKLEIQRAALQLLGVAHHVVFHDDLPKRKISNLRWIRDGYLRDGEREPYPGYFDDIKSRLAASWPQSGLAACTLAEHCARFDTSQGAERGTGLKAARMLMLDRWLVPDLEVPSLADALLTSFQLASRERSHLRAVGGA